MGSGPSRFTVAHEAALIGTVSLLLGITAVADAWVLAGEPRDEVSPFWFIEYFLAGIGHAGWISMNRIRRGLPVGAWRYAAVFLGPLAVWLYLILEYRLRALYLVPLSVLVYLGVAAGMALVMAAAAPFSLA